MSPSAEPVNLPDDPRFEHRFASVNGVKYHYLLAEPKGRSVRATVVLVSFRTLASPRLLARWPRRAHVAGNQPVQLVLLR